MKPIEILACHISNKLNVRELLNWSRTRTIWYWFYFLYAFWNFGQVDFLFEKKSKSEKVVLLADVLNAHQNPVVVNCNTRTERVVQSSNSVALFRVAPPAESNNERDFGLYSHCLGAGYLLACWGSVISFGSSGAETVVVVVQDQRGSFQSRYCFLFLF